MAVALQADLDQGLTAPLTAPFTARRRAPAQFQDPLAILLLAAIASLGDRTNLVYRDTAVAQGTGLAVGDRHRDHESGGLDDPSGRQLRHSRSGRAQGP